MVRLPRVTVSNTWCYGDRKVPDPNAPHFDKLSASPYNLKEDAIDPSEFSGLKRQNIASGK